MGSVLIHGVEIGGVAGQALRTEGGVITALGNLRPSPADDEVIAGGGGALIPGLHDHHVHLRSWAAALGSFKLGPPEVTSPAAFADALRRAASAYETAAAGSARVSRPTTSTGQAPTGGWIRGVGYHESVAGLPDASALDVLVPSIPVRIEHRSGAMWLLNSAALDRLGAHRATDPAIERDTTGAPTGRIRRGDGWIAAATGNTAPDMRSVGRRAAAYGVTHFTDADPYRADGAVDHLRRSLASGAIPQRVLAMGQPDLVLPAHRRLTLGPVKLLLDDDEAADVDAVAALVRRAHRGGRAVAIHCVTRLQLVASLTALDSAGGNSSFGDRIEHGSVIPPELIATIRRLRLTVVTQPGFVAERGDAYRHDVDPEDLTSLYRCRSLIDAGVPVLLSTDAPYSDPDPWLAIRAAGHRRTPNGAVLGPAERISPAAALVRMMSAPMLRIGQPADVCLLREPLESALAEATPPEVAATFVAGERVHP